MFARSQALFLTLSEQKIGCNLKRFFIIVNKMNRVSEWHAYPPEKPMQMLKLEVFLKPRRIFFSSDFTIWEFLKCFFNSLDH